MSTERIAVIADIHLTDIPGTAQEAALSWAVDCLRRDAPALVIVAGDLTAMGTRHAARRARQMLDSLGLPLVITPGNAELRTASETAGVLAVLESTQIVQGRGWLALAADSSTGEIPAGERRRVRAALLEHDASQPLMLVTHMPLKRLQTPDRAWLEEVVQGYPQACLVAAHTHRDDTGMLGRASWHVLRGLDPDKAIGAPPCVSFFEYTGGAWRRTDRVFDLASAKGWSAAEQDEWRRNLGFSCMNEPLQGLHEGSVRGVPVLELRADTLTSIAHGRLAEAVSNWRRAGGRHLSLHLPNLRWDPIVERVTGVEDFSEAVHRACSLHCDALTVHVPRCAVGALQPGSAAWRQFTDVLSESLAPAVSMGLVVGIENMHLGRNEPLDDSRGYGYTPAECEAWIENLKRETGYERIGMHLDIGHARNNGALASRFPLGTWYALLGARITGVHLHQVMLENGRLSNHHPIEGLYGPQISLASFFWAWRSGRLRHAPLILEIRAPGNGWETWDHVLSAMDMPPGTNAADIAHNAAAC